MQESGEDPWEIENCSTSCKDNDILGWRWRRRLSLGKKVALTSVVITSAPLILLPFLALSTLGIVFSVPAGFAYVTYVCTLKFVNLLLPMPSQSSLLEKSTRLGDEEVEWINPHDGEAYKKDEETKADEKGFKEEGMKEIEMRIGLEEGNNKIDNYYQTSVKGGKFTEFVEESLYEEDVEYTKHEEQVLNSNAIPNILEGIREAEDEMSVMKKEYNELPMDSVQAVVVAADVTGESENNVDLVLEQMSLLAPSHLKDVNTDKGGFSGKHDEEMRKKTTGMVREMRDEDKHHKEMHDRAAQQIVKKAREAREIQ